MLKLFLIFLIGLSLFVPVFAQNTTNSTIPANTTSSIRDISPDLLWNVGVFAIIGSAITFIGILLTIRFVYIDKNHEERIGRIKDDIEGELEKQEKLVDEKEFVKDNVRHIADYVSSLHIALADVKRHKRANNYTGLRIDVSCMSVLFATGVFATTGIFTDEFLILLLIVGVVGFLPVTHFIIQLNGIKHKFKFDLS